MEAIETALEYECLTGMVSLLTQEEAVLFATHHSGNGCIYSLVNLEVNSGAEEEYQKRQLKRLARRIQKAQGVKYTTALRMAERMTVEEVKDGAIPSPEGGS